MNKHEANFLMAEKHLRKMMVQLERDIAQTRQALIREHGLEKTLEIEAETAQKIKERYNNEIRNK